MIVSIRNKYPQQNEMKNNFQFSEGKKWHTHATNLGHWVEDETIYYWAIHIHNDHTSLQVLVVAVGYSE